ncbi:tetratricopeptide repeat protein [Maribacter litopenaei]|uniref:Tetratricopeptide repeat protein n=1 Tax=Maribacter litopenaei TaxID=2976127 RepID=A0ABY5YAI9_9FLAO|nr:tetratricopeptide repeat protein [Maribacter litopenaei]UWX55130.1 tetratricopeptide repeat protein [Maribacter litopenaei]
MVLLFFYSARSQKISDQFKNEVAALIDEAPRTYERIDSFLRSSRKDTVLMKFVIEQAKKNQYPDAEIYALNHLGRAYRDISNYPKALDLFQEALRLSIEADNLEFRIYSLNMISVVYRRTEAVKSALDYSQEALELAETIKPEDRSKGLKRSINVSLNSIGNIYQLLEQYDLAIEKFNESMKLEEELDNKLGLAINHQNVGECYEATGKLEPALESFQKSLSYNEEINSEKGKVICNYSIAHVYVHQKRMDEALTMLTSSLERAKALGDQEIIATILNNLGWANLNIGDFSKAEAYLQEGLKTAKMYNYPSEISEANKFLSELWMKKDDFKKAMDFYMEFKKYEEQVTNNLNVRYVNDMIVRYEAEKQSDQLKSLEEEVKNQAITLRKNKTMLLVTFIGLALAAGILYILYRQYQLSSEKKLLTLEQTMLRSQMNPHFLFNSLNSIKLYIINNEKKNAVHYLNKFSKLVRKILEASSQREISLAEELETVELYMNIENIRFSNEISFKINIADDIDVHSIKIPSLILQPFLENALWHGLSSKEGEKNIHPDVTKGQEGFINIAITDDGVGRDAAEKIKERKVLKRKSVGINITKERLANFSKDYQNSFHVEIIDIYDDDNKPSGTKILLRIPTI